MFRKTSKILKSAKIRRQESYALKYYFFYSVLLGRGVLLTYPYQNALFQAMAQLPKVHY